MGAWSFVKDAGRKLFGVGAANAAEVPEEALQKEIDQLGRDTGGLSIEVAGDKVQIVGKAVRQANLRIPRD